MARKIVRNSKGSRKTIKTYQFGGKLIDDNSQTYGDRLRESEGYDAKGMYQIGGSPSDDLPGDTTEGPLGIYQKGGSTGKK